MRACALVLLALLATPAAADPGDPVRLRVGTLAIDGSRYMIDSLALGAEIARRTRGAVQLDWVANGQLGDDAAMAALIARGELDGGGLTEVGLATLVPEMAVWGLPGVLGTDAEVDRATAALDPAVRELFAQRGLAFAMWADLGFARLFARAPIDDAVLRRAAPWLALPLDGKLTEAIASGRAPAWALPPLYMLALPDRPARHAVDLRYRYVVGGLVFSRAAWARLSAGEQATVLEVCRAWEPRIRASWRKETARGLATLAKLGVETRVTTAAERAAFAAASAKLRAPRVDALGLSTIAAKIAAALAD